MSTQFNLDDQLISACNHGKDLRDLIAAGADVNATNAQGYKPLYIAAREGWTKALEQLLAAGADVNGAPRSGWTALHAASVQGHLPVVRILIAAGADIDAKTEHNYTAFYNACNNGHTEIGIELLKAGCNVAPHPKTSISPLDLEKADGVRSWYQSHMAAQTIASAMVAMDESSATTAKPRGGLAL